MLTNLQNYLFLLILAAVSYWLVPSNWPRLRLAVLLGFSGFAVFLISPVSLFSAITMTVIAYAALKILQRQSSAVALWSAVVALLACTGLVRHQFGGVDVLAAVGLSYVLLKSTSVLVDEFWKASVARATRLDEVLLLNIFFPIYAAGPIAQGRDFVLERLATRWQSSDVVEGVGRIAVGIFKSVFIAQELIDGYLTANYPASADPWAGGALSAWVYAVLRFLSLYLSFSGYTDMAVGSGRLFGLTVPENFRMPLLAVNVQDFWRRWHLSLARFVNVYIFFPLGRALRGRVELAIVLSFVAVGLWHSISWPYLLWGLGHGVALAFNMHQQRLARRSASWSAIRESAPYTVLSWAATLAYVSVLSTFANAPSLGSGLIFLRALVGVT